MKLRLHSINPLGSVAPAVSKFVLKEEHEVYTRGLVTTTVVSL